MQTEQKCLAEFRLRPHEDALEPCDRASRAGELHSVRALGSDSWNALDGERTAQTTEGLLRNIRLSIPPRFSTPIRHRRLAAALAAACGLCTLLSACSETTCRAERQLHPLPGRTNAPTSLILLASPTTLLPRMWTLRRRPRLTSLRAMQCPHQRLRDRSAEASGQVGLVFWTVSVDME